MAAPVPFETVPAATQVTSKVIDEASGIADSKSVPGNLWVQQDSGNPSDLFLLSYDGTIKKKIRIKGATNRDWEDLAIGSGPDAGANYLYLAETGDNTASEIAYFIYRFVEPTMADDTIRTYDRINFKYADGAHDAEAIFVDNTTKDIYIVTKRDAKSKVFKLAYPQSTTSQNTATLVSELGFTGATGAAMSADGKELLVRTYMAINYWKRSAGESVDAMLKKAPTSLAHQLEPQGEAICFKNDNTGFYTLSEKPSIVPYVNINFYKRK